MTGWCATLSFSRKATLLATCRPAHVPQWQAYRHGSGFRESVRAFGATPRRDTMATKIRRDILESYVHCTYKGHLKLAGAQGSPADYEVLQGEARNRVRRAGTARLAGRHKDGEIL